MKKPATDTKAEMVVADVWTKAFEASDAAREALAEAREARAAWEKRTARDAEAAWAAVREAADVAWAAVEADVASREARVRAAREAEVAWAAVWEAEARAADAALPT